jgi:hypothetical protein
MVSWVKIHYLINGFRVGKDSISGHLQFMIGIYMILFEINRHAFFSWAIKVHDCLHLKFT